MKLTSLQGVCAAVALVLCGCQSTPPIQPPVPSTTPEKPPLLGEVVARNDRLLIYVPSNGESLRGIAGRLLGNEDNEWQISEANGGLSKVDPGQPIVVPLKPQNPLGVWPGSYQTIPVLCYHRLGTTGGKMAVSPGNFAAQMEWLVRNNYHVLKLAQLGPYLEGKQALPPRSVVVTFDDGYESVYRFAFPVLKKLGLPATMFVYTDFLGAGDALTWPQLQEMSASGLMDIQSHSKTHRNLIERAAGENDERYARNIEQEVVLPRDMLEKRLNAPVRHFAFPYGDANDLVLDQLTRQKFSLAVTVNPGGNAFFAQPLMLRRTMIFGDHDLEAFKARLQTSRKIGGTP
ncbi:Peptidoglycan/xylan/chitin deacetylase, PgdA/CDA1 family [Roseateles sp. YR242]|uniref:polysaccharide deacetylase family protein n=1 Tax=Roseateles sp. YR242 TaxID=1855305 RepID=UPI0008D1D72D|nr:polysaccharide deacetylase family protein [Roseateles sp. YR242]SEL36250.1 Peptidoglycan/xylan/chitin deacetylase, PgdA/CDA1 family [Roseateles sp. YR242]